jgi:hypothetical protein
LVALGARDQRPRRDSIELWLLLRRVSSCHAS